jgi:hypothetical protein
LRKQSIDADLVDVSPEAIPSAQSLERLIICRNGHPPTRGRLLPGQQAVDLRIGDAMMTTFSRGRTDPPTPQPALQRRVPNAKPLRCRSRREKCHVLLQLIESVRIVSL